MYLVLFDVDGTLVDSQNIIFEGMRRAFEGAGKPEPTRAAVLSIIGMSLPVALAELSGGSEGDALTAELVEGYKVAFQDLRRMATHYEALYPGAKEALLALKRRDDVILGIATGKSRRGVVAVVDIHGLEGLFATVQTADGHPSKPHPSMILTALAEAGVAPDHAVMVGDSSYDIEMARAAGVYALGVSWGYQSVEALEAAGAHAVVDS
ncbi:MAG: HAD-IA family hydrolase, partial [Ancalomicrobiaceae bacterium]|nr:HAD-IA family hydrolase [Ancalomicrobiaceae bacterium]